MADARPNPSGRPPRAGGGNRSVWILVAAVVLVVLGVLLIVREVGADAEASPSPSGTGAATTSAPPSSAPADPSPSATPEPTTSTSAPATTPGCAPTDETTPAGADVVTVVDVDADGQNDQAWLTGGADRRFGITTASGATFSVAVESASPIAASAVVNTVQEAQIPIALVTVGRETFLYGLRDCAITEPANAQGEPYTFDGGFTGEGTGVGCIAVEPGVLRLAGLDAVAADDGTYTVTRTYVDLSADATSAANGETETVAEGAAADDPAVTSAGTVSCGELVAGQDGPTEPGA